MKLLQTVMPDVVLAAGTTDIDINYERDYFDAESITFQAPTYAETLSFQGSLDGSVFVSMKDGAGNSISPPATDEMKVYNGIFPPLKTLRIHSTSAVAADRTFKVIKSWRGC